jgi:hypothetical protein
MTVTLGPHYKSGHSNQSTCHSTAYGTLSASSSPPTVPPTHNCRSDQTAFVIGPWRLLHPRFTSFYTAYTEFWQHNRLWTRIVPITHRIFENSMSATTSRSPPTKARRSICFVPLDVHHHHALFVSPPIESQALSLKHSLVYSTVQCEAASRSASHPDRLRSLN